MNLRSLNSSSMQGASFDREIASGFARKAISQDGEAVRSDSSAVAVDDAQVARTTSAPVVLRVGFKAGKMTAGKHGEDPEVSEAVRCLQKSRLGYRFVKRAFDIVFSAFVLIAFSWLFAIVAIAIEIDDPRGPVIFKQKRVGKDGKEFNMYKFRSKCVDAEDRLAELRELNEKSGPVFKIAADPRITRVGKWLRKLSLASVIIGTPGPGSRPTPYRQQQKPHLTSSFTSGARKLSPATQSIIPAPNSCLSPFSGVLGRPKMSSRLVRTVPIKVALLGVTKPSIS